MVVAASSPWATIDVSEAIAHRSLLWNLTRREIKVRYKQTGLGVLWAVLQPLLLMAIFTFFFGRLAQVPSGGIPYPIFAFAALLPWTLFSNGLSSSGNSLVNNANLITKVYFPRVLIPASAIVAASLDALVASLLLLPLAFISGVDLRWATALLALPILGLAALSALGFGLVLSALNVRYRDVKFAIPFLLQVGLFATPVIYPVEFAPERWRWIFYLNPMAGTIEAFRSVLFGLPMKWNSLALAVVVVLATIAFGSIYFRRMERAFADVI